MPKLFLAPGAICANGDDARWTSGDDADPDWPTEAAAAALGLSKVLKELASEIKSMPPFLLAVTEP